MIDTCSTWNMECSWYCNSGVFHSVDQKGEMIGLTPFGSKDDFFFSVCVFCLNHLIVFFSGLGQRKAVCIVGIRKTWVLILALPLSGCATLGKLFNLSE